MQKVDCLPIDQFSSILLVCQLKQNWVCGKSYAQARCHLWQRHCIIEIHKSFHIIILVAKPCFLITMLTFNSLRNPIFLTLSGVLLVTHVHMYILMYVYYILPFLQKNGTHNYVGIDVCRFKLYWGTITTAIKEKRITSTSLDTPRKGFLPDSK